MPEIGEFVHVQFTNEEATEAVQLGTYTTEEAAVAAMEESKEEN